MKIIEKLNAKRDIYNAPPVTIAFLGDSVTQGCFECYIDENGCIETVFDNKSAYSERLRELLSTLYPMVQVNIINSGISGDTTEGALKRLDRDILAYSPDLVVVSFGLNDSGKGLEGLAVYADNVREIIEKTKNDNTEVIFLTQNYMNSKISCHLKEASLRKCAENNMIIQNNNVLKAYMDKAKTIAKESGAVICDLFSVWEKMADGGVDTTELLANKINHPIKEYHYYIAIKLLETMFEI